MKVVFAILITILLAACSADMDILEGTSTLQPLPSIDSQTIETDINEATESEATDIIENDGRTIRQYSDFIAAKPAGYNDYCVLESVNVGIYENVTIAADIMPLLHHQSFMELYFYIFGNTGELLEELVYGIDGLSFMHIESLTVHDINRDGKNDLLFCAYGIAGNSVFERYCGGAFVSDGSRLYLDEELNDKWIHALSYEEARYTANIVWMARQYYQTEIDGFPCNDQDDILLQYGVIELHDDIYNERSKNSQSYSTIAAISYPSIVESSQYDGADVHSINNRLRYIPYQILGAGVFPDRFLRQCVLDYDGYDYSSVGFSNWYGNARYSVVSADEEIISIVYRCTASDGQGNRIMTGLATLDIQTGKILTLDDIFWTEAVSNGILSGNYDIIEGGLKVNGGGGSNIDLNRYLAEAFTETLCTPIYDGYDTETDGYYDTSSSKYFCIDDNYVYVKIIDKGAENGYFLLRIERKTDDNISDIFDFIGMYKTVYSELSKIRNVDVGAYQNASIIADVLPSQYGITVSIFSNSGELLSQLEYCIEGFAFEKVSSLAVSDVNRDGLNDLMFSAYGIGESSPFKRNYGVALISKGNMLQFDDALNNCCLLSLSDEEAMYIENIIWQADVYYQAEEMVFPNPALSNKAIEYEIADKSDRIENYHRVNAQSFRITANIAYPSIERTKSESKIKATVLNEMLMYIPYQIVGGGAFPDRYLRQCILDFDGSDCSSAGFANWYGNARYSVVTADEEIISIVYRCTASDGQGNRIMTGLATLDIQTGKILTLDDIFWTEAVSNGILSGNYDIIEGGFGEDGSAGSSAAMHGLLTDAFSGAPVGSLRDDDSRDIDGYYDVNSSKYFCIDENFIYLKIVYEEAENGYVLIRINLNGLG